MRKEEGSSRRSCVRGSEYADLVYGLYMIVYDCIWFMVIHPIIGILRMGVLKSYSITGLRTIPQCGNGSTPWYLHNPFPRP